MLRAQTCLNLYIFIHVKASCTDRAEELSQCAGLSFKTETKQQLPYLIQSPGLRFLSRPHGQPFRSSYRQQTRPVNKSSLSLHHTHKDTRTAIHSQKLLEAPNAFSNYQYMAFSVEERHKDQHVSIAHFLLSVHQEPPEPLHFLYYKRK